MRSTEKAGRRRTDDKASGRKAKPAHCGRCAALVRGRYASDSLTVSFFDASHAPVHTFQFDRVTGGQATLTFDDTVSAKFPKGAYFYDILYTHGDKTTLARDNRAAAE